MKPNITRRLATLEAQRVAVGQDADAEILDAWWAALPDQDAWLAEVARGETYTVPAAVRTAGARLLAAAGVVVKRLQPRDCDRLSNDALLAIIAADAAS